jgi:predicted DNA-binding protein (MmcQ/YjbR family)
MTIDELRALCLSLPGTTEKETWGDAEHAGDVTFRIKDKIYLITGPDGGGATIRTTIEQQADLIAAFPRSAKVAAYVGRFGWVSVEIGGPDALDPEVVRETVRSAWRRTIPKAMLRELEAAET